jgi:hypothetical protein
MTNTPIDSEIAALQAIHDILEPLDHATRARVLEWAFNRFVLQTHGRAHLGSDPNQTAMTDEEWHDWMKANSKEEL